MHGAWRTGEAEYARDVRRYKAEIGRLVWAAPQDWMCEPHILAKTGKTVSQHQHLTVDNFSRLRDQNPDLKFIPVLQGFTEAEYHDCALLYEQAGHALTREPIVGLGSICRKQGTNEADRIVRSLASTGIRLHGFGFKTSGLAKCYPHFASSDSMAWSFTARRTPVLMDGCVLHKNCANCFRYAQFWRQKLTRHPHRATRTRSLRYCGASLMLTTMGSLVSSAPSAASPTARIIWLKKRNNTTRSRRVRRRSRPCAGFRRTRAASRARSTA